MASNVRQRGSQISNQTPSNAAAGVQNNDNINIVLLGKTGVGKSSSGNTILGQNRFTCESSMSAVTNVSSIEKSEIRGRSVSVIDTPGFFCTNLPKEELAEEFARSVYLSVPGVHAFLLVVPYGRFTEQEEQILDKVKEVFGKEVLKHVILLFTYGDKCKKEKIESEIKGNKFVSRVVQSCHGYHVLNNEAPTDTEQVQDLLQMIYTMTEWNQGYYTNEMYKWAQLNTFQKFWKMLKDFFYAVIEFFQNLSKRLNKNRYLEKVSPYMSL